NDLRGGGREFDSRVRVAGRADDDLPRAPPGKLADELEPDPAVGARDGVGVAHAPLWPPTSPPEPAPCDRLITSGRPRNRGGRFYRRPIAADMTPGRASHSASRSVVSPCPWTRRDPHRLYPSWPASAAGDGPWSCSAWRAPC